MYSLHILRKLDFPFPRFVHNLFYYFIGDSITGGQTETNSILKGDSFLGSSSAAGSKLISSIAMTKPLSSEQQKKRAAMLFGKFF